MERDLGSNRAQTFVAIAILALAQLRQISLDGLMGQMDLQPPRLSTTCGMAVFAKS